jgi:hypothetical protein
MHKSFLGIKIDKHDNVTFIIVPFIIYDVSIENTSAADKDARAFV